MRPPGPPEILPSPPTAVVDLQTDAGTALVAGRWSYRVSDFAAVDFRMVGADLGPTGPPSRTVDLGVRPATFGDGDWAPLAPADTMRRLGPGLVSAVWYRIDITVPDEVGGVAVRGSTLVLEVVVDDYAEVWVADDLPLRAGRRDGHVVGGFNVPNRVVLTTDARPGETFPIAVCGINGPLSRSPANFVWLRSATLDVHPAPPAGGAVTTVATGFASVDALLPVPDGMLVSSATGNTVYTWVRDGWVEVFRPKSGYTGPDIGRLDAPGALGLAHDHSGRLLLAQRGHRRVLRVEPHGDTTVVLAGHAGRPLNGPAHLAVDTAGTLYVTDPAGASRAGRHDGDLPPDAVHAVSPDGDADLLCDSVPGAFGIAVAPGGDALYVSGSNADAAQVWCVPTDGGRPEVYADLSHLVPTGPPGRPGLAGVAVSGGGRLHVATPTGVAVVSPDGTAALVVALPEPARHLAWDTDGALVVAAGTSLYRIESPPEVTP